MEIWKPIPSYEGLYEISDLGNVRTIKGYRIDKNGKRYRMPIKNLRPLTSTDQYHFVYLYKDGIPTPLRVHRLVLMAFCGQPPDGYCANHKDGNRINNWLDNLEWASPSENNYHAYAVLGKKPTVLPGEQSPNSKLSNEDIYAARALRQEKHTFQFIANKFGISKSHAKRIVDGDSWKHLQPR